MATRQIDETFQLSDVAGTAEKVYQSPGGEVLIVSKLAIINTDTTANCVVNIWIDPTGGSSVADGDLNHLVVEETIAAKQRLPISAAGRNIPVGGQIMAEVTAAAGGNFQNKCNIHVSGVLVTQNRAATGTSA